MFSALNWNGTEYVGDFQFADGDLLTMSEGSVSFDLPDYASVFAAQPGFAYSLKKYGESVELASRPGQVQLTSAGAILHGGRRNTDLCLSFLCLCGRRPALESAHGRGR